MNSDEIRSDPVLRVGTLTIDTTARVAELGDEPLVLADREFDLLVFLAERPSRVHSRDELLQAVWHSSATRQHPSTVTEHVRRLRLKLGEDPRRPRILHTVRGVGYRLDPPRPAPDTAPSAASTGPADGAEPARAPRRATFVHVDGRVVHADAGAAALMGLDRPDELVGLRIDELVPDPWSASVRERRDGGVPAAAHRTQLVVVDRPDGTNLSVKIASEASTWKGRRATFVTAIEVDDLAGRLRPLIGTVIDDLSDAVFVTDAEFHLLDWNAAAERMYGWARAEVLGRHLLDVVRSFGGDLLLQVAREALWADGRWKGQPRHLRRDGAPIDVAASSTLVRDEAGEPHLVVSVNRLVGDRSGPPQVRIADDIDIRRGLEDDEFEMHYQPIVSLTDLEVVKMEALLRWNHPERGLLMPHSIIDRAERSGAIVELGNLVLEKAAGAAIEWRRAGRELGVAVNLSARQLSDPHLFDRISTVLAFTGLEPQGLWLEVTETALIEEVDQASAMLHRLADTGIRISIDDFGTGWASLTYLRRFPIHALKIDRSFVAGVGVDPSDTAIARSVLGLGRDLGLAVVAEGIETVAQQEALRALGCELGQGYLYGRPAPLDAAALEPSVPRS